MVNRIPAETDILRTKLGIANERIRLLEDALQKAHSRLSDAIHPLLEKSEKRQKATRSRALGASNLSSDSEDPGPVESFGTLAIADDGESLFLGPSAASEVSHMFLFSRGAFLDQPCAQTLIAVSCIRNGSGLVRNNTSF